MDRDPDILDFTSREISNATKFIKTAMAFDGSERRALKRAAGELGVKWMNMNPARLASVRCCFTKYAKVRYETLAEAQSNPFGLSTYPCNHCLYWHNTNFKSKIKKAINCLGCGLPMADRGHKYCCPGCKRRNE